MAVILWAVSLTGCAATQVAIAKRDLDVQTRLSATIFLDPVKDADRTVFVQIRNTSDKPDLDVAADIAAAVAAKGYRVVTDPDQAHYYLQANVLYVGRSSATANQEALSGGYGGAMGGAMAGAALAGATGGAYGPSGRSVMGAALLGGIAETVSGALVKDVYFSIVTDVQIKERLAAGKSAQVNSKHNLTQGTSGSDQVTFSDSSNLRAYQTRIVSTANKMNLEFAEAAAPLRHGLVRALSGLF
jgi:outer membrane lipoprotein SlyB